jgi:diacylglycerol kinase (ATP)
MPDKCLVIANPTSGLGFGRKNAPRLEAALRSVGYDVDLIWATERDTAQVTAASASPDDVAIILCVGGDGTFNQVINGLNGKPIPVTIFPTGTGNVLAKEYGIPYSIPRVCEMIRRGKTEMLDVGVIAGRRFGLFAGAGFDAAVAMTLAQSRTGRISMLSYVVPTIKALLTYRFPEMEVVVDGQLVGQATCVLICNIHSYGGPFGFVEDADPTDGLFDICLMRGRSRTDLLRYLWGGLRGRILEYYDTTQVRGSSVELRAKAPVPIQVDGDYSGKLPVRIDLLHAEVPVIVP